MPVFLNLDQSAISTSTRRILSSRSVNYRRPPRRVKPIDFDLDEQCDKTNGNDFFLHYSDSISTHK